MHKLGFQSIQINRIIAWPGRNRKNILAPAKPNKFRKRKDNSKAKSKKRRKTTIRERVWANLKLKQT